MVVAAKPISAGSVVFLEEAYCFAQTAVSGKRQLCLYCCGSAALPFDSCEACGSVFCSENCALAHKKNHSTTGECCAIIFYKSAKAMIPAEDLDTFKVTCMVLARCAAENKNESLSMDAANSDSDGFETVGSGNETASPLQFLNETDTSCIRTSSYDHVECLGTNLRETNPEIILDFSKLYPVYCKTLQNRKFIHQTRDAVSTLPKNVSCKTFVAICAAFLCNGFGIWDRVNHQLGVALYPQSSYFNHSCAPNLGRRNRSYSRIIEFFAARDILEGEPLCISYIDLKLPAVERKLKLKATYSFECVCIRCRPDADDMTANTVCGECVPALCCNCISKVMQPLETEKYICPCCNQVQTISP